MGMSKRGSLELLYEEIVPAQQAFEDNAKRSVELKAKAYDRPLTKAEMDELETLGRIQDYLTSYIKHSRIQAVADLVDFDIETFIWALKGKTVEAVDDVVRGEGDQ